MKQRSSVPCILSLMFGITIYPLSLLTAFSLLNVCFNRIPDERAAALTTFMVTVVILIFLEIAGFALGMIGIIQHRKKRGMAIAGVVLSSLKLVLFICFCLILFVQPSLLFGIL